MKRSVILSAIALICIVACKPKQYLGPLDSPLGNWKSSESIYYFNGETVWQNDTCEYTAISFYKDSLCCIEGRKGTFEYHMSDEGDMLTVDSLVWEIEELTGRFLKLQYVEDLRMEEAGIPAEGEDDGDSEDADADPITLPVDYKGMSIVSDGNGGYMYLGRDGKPVPCRYIAHPEEDGTFTVDCWFDSRHDTYRPF